MKYTVHKNKPEYKFHIQIFAALVVIFVWMAYVFAEYRILWILFAFGIACLTAKKIMFLLNGNELLILTEETIEICKNRRGEFLKIRWEEVTNCKTYLVDQDLQIRFYYRDDAGRHRRRYMHIKNKAMLQYFARDYAVEDVKDICSMIDLCWKQYGSGGD